jgi:hypothetical protein
MCDARHTPLLHLGICLRCGSAGALPPPLIGRFLLDWAAHYRAAFFSGQATVCSVDDQDIAQFLLREGWAELPIDVTDQAYVEVALRGIGYRQRFTAFRQMAP